MSTRARDLADLLPPTAPVVGEVLTAAQTAPGLITDWTPPIAEAALDIWTYGRSNGQWARVVPMTGSIVAMTGPLILNADPVQPMHAATKQYVDAGGSGGLPDAPQDGVTYGRNTAAWVATLPLTGGTLTGALILSGAPAQPLQAATKTYVDNSLANAMIDCGTYG